MLDFQKTERMMEAIYRCLERIAFWNMLTMFFLALLIIITLVKKEE